MGNEPSNKTSQWALHHLVSIISTEKSAQSKIIRWQFSNQPPSWKNICVTALEYHLTSFFDEGWSTPLINQWGRTSIIGAPKNSRVMYV